MVACHRKLRMLLLDHEINQILLLRKLIAETHSVVVDPETDIHQTVSCSLLHLHKHLVVMVTYVAGLSPHRLPGLIEL